MRERPVGTTGISLTEIGLGAAPLGNLYVETSDDEARAAVDAAWECGIRYFDVAPHYGLGLAERRLGRALAGRPREDFIVSTKVGRLLDPNPAPRGRDPDLFAVPDGLVRRWDFTRDGVRRSLEDSLARMGLDRVDILYLHDPDVSGDPDAARTGGAALVALREEGLARAVGIGSNSATAIADAFASTDIDLAMIAGRFTLLEPRGADRVLHAAADRPIVVAGAFNSGILAHRRPPATATYDYRAAPPGVVQLAGRIADVAERHGATLPQAAIAFPLREAQVSSVVLGMRSAEEVRENVRRYRRRPSTEFWTDLTTEGLLP